MELATATVPRNEEAALKDCESRIVSGLVIQARWVLALSQVRLAFVGTNAFASLVGIPARRDVRVADTVCDLLVLAARSTDPSGEDATIGVLTARTLTATCENRK